ncbi:uncharacterized protein LOC144752552 [Lissotriton helveticus]
MEPSNEVLEPQQQQQQPRKRKVKFSDKELEILIEEVTAKHEQLFGKTSLKVPEAMKRKIWITIQAKVNAVGVAHRDISNLQKRWYDLRSRAKEKIATRIKSSRKTGGGTPKDIPTTPWEELVEGTLPTEAVIGVFDIDTSEQPGPSQDADLDAEFIQFAESFTQDLLNDTGNNFDPPPSPTVEPQSQRRRLRQLVDTESEAEDNVNTEVPNTTVNAEPAQRGPGRRQRLRQFIRRRRRPFQNHEAMDDIVNGSVIERKLLKVQRLQGKDIRVIKGTITNMAKDMNIMSTALVNMVNVSSDKMERMTSAIETLSQAMQGNQGAVLQRATVVNMHSSTRAMHRMCNNTSKLIESTVAIQKEMMKCYGELSSGMKSMQGLISEHHQGQSITQPESAVTASSAENPNLKSKAASERRSVRNVAKDTFKNLTSNPVQVKALGLRGRKK